MYLLPAVAVGTTVGAEDVVADVEVTGTVLVDTTGWALGVATVGAATTMGAGEVVTVVVAAVPGCDTANCGLK